MNKSIGTQKLNNQSSKYEIGKTGLASKGSYSAAQGKIKLNKYEIGSQDNKGGGCGSGGCKESSSSKPVTPKPDSDQHKTSH